MWKPALVNPVSVCPRGPASVNVCLSECASILSELLKGLDSTVSEHFAH